MGLLAKTGVFTVYHTIHARHSHNAETWNCLGEYSASVLRQAIADPCTGADEYSAFNLTLYPAYPDRAAVVASCRRLVPFWVFLKIGATDLDFPALAMIY